MELLNSLAWPDEEEEQDDDEEEVEEDEEDDAEDRSSPEIFEDEINDAIYGDE